MRSWGVVSSCQCFYNGPLMIIKVVTPNTSIQPTFSVYPSPLSFYIKTEHSSAVCDAACQILEDQNSGLLLLAALPWHVKTIQMVPLLKALKLIKGSFIQFCDVGCGADLRSSVIWSYPRSTIPHSSTPSPTRHEIILFTTPHYSLFSCLISISFHIYLVWCQESPKSRQWVQRLLFSNS